MAKEVKVPKEELAPAYFVQYSALWCIMLGFFVLLLSLGDTQTGPGEAGVGAVRDSFGITGGLGMLPFAQNAFQDRDNQAAAASLRIVRNNPEKAGFSFDGYVRGMLSERGLSDLSFWIIEEVPGKTKVVIGLPIKFRDDMHLETDSVRLLEVLSEVVFHLSGHRFDCMMYLDEGPDRFAAQKKALLRSGVVARFITEACAMPEGTIGFVGYHDNRYLAAHGIHNVSGKILLSIQ